MAPSLLRSNSLNAFCAYATPPGWAGVIILKMLLAKSTICLALRQSVSKFYAGTA
jgi:hypothetical protein